MSSAEGVLSSLARASRLRDVLLVVGVPVVLLGIYAAPLEARRALILSYSDPTLLTAYASHFVHLDGSHLLANVGAYYLVAPLLYAYCAMSGRRTGFLATFVVFFVAFPVVLSALNVLLVRPRVGYGLSGVNAAFYGFLPTALVWYGHDRLGLALRLDHAPALFFLGAGVIALRAVPSRSQALLLGGFAALVALGYVVVLAKDLRPDLGAALGAGRGHLELAVVGLVLFCWFPFVAFPTQVWTGDLVVNIYTHLLGYCLGFIAPYITFRVT